MIKTNQRGFSPIMIILFIVLVGMIGGTGYYIYQTNGDSNKVSDSQPAAKDIKSNPVLTPSPTPKISPVPTKITFDAKAEEAAIIAAIKAEKAKAGGCQMNGETEKISVMKVTENGFATGSYSCGNGYIYVAQKINGLWKELYGYQEGPYCSQINQFKVSKDLFDECIVQDWNGESIADAYTKPNKPGVYYKKNLNP